MFHILLIDITSFLIAKMDLPPDPVEMANEPVPLPADFSGERSHVCGILNDLNDKPFQTKG